MKPSVNRLLSVWIVALAMVASLTAGSAWAATASAAAPASDDAAQGGYSAATLQEAAAQAPAPGNPTSLSSATVLLPNSQNLVYTGRPVQPTVQVVLNGKALSAASDYSIVYRNNLHAGTAVVTVTGKGSYTGSASTTFTIGKAEQTVTTSKSKYKKTYGAAAFRMKAKSSAGGQITFKSGDKHVVTISRSGKVKVRGAGSTKITVEASETADYKSAAKTVKVKVKRKSITSAKVKLGRTSYAYNGKAHEPKVTVKAGGHKLKRDKDYKLVYKRNVNVGKAVVYVKGKGNYKGTQKKAFVVNAPAASDSGTASNSNSASESSASEEEADPEPEQPAISETVYITRTGDCYHRDGCRYLRQSRIPIALSDAIAGGYRACSVCNP